jgi:hypothetical protein
MRRKIPVKIAALNQKKFPVELIEKKRIAFENRPARLCSHPSERFCLSLLPLYFFDNPIFT